MEFIFDHKIKFFLYIVFTALLYQCQYILSPDYYGKVISAFKDKSPVYPVIKMLLIISIITNIIDDLVLYLQYLIVPNFSEYITGSFLSFILNNYDYDFDNIKIGETISKMSKLPEVLFDYIDVFRLDFLKQTFVFITAIFHYYTISKTLLLVFIGYIIVNYIFFYIIFKQFSFYNKDVNSFQDTVYEYLNDTFQNMSSVYSLNQQKYEKKRFYNFSFIEYKNLFGASFLSYLYGYLVWAFVNVSMYIVMNYLLYKTYKNKQINSATLISSFVITWSILSLYEKTIDSAWNLSMVNSKLSDAQSYFNTIFESNKSIKTNTNKFIAGDIIVSNVYHKYGDKFVLENVSLKIKKGEKVAFVGPIGSGKSTLVKLLMGYQPLLLGTITINGININDISNKEIRKEIFYIPQKPKLFNRTLYENIVYGIDKPPTKGQLKELLDMFKISFDLDMDDNVGVEGNSLSGGQRQMVWLIRSFLRPSSILVMDEPTSALDPENKLLVNNIIKKVSSNKTVIIVSHDAIDPSFRKIEFNKGIIKTRF